MELSQIQALAERVKAALSENLNEANTKSSLIMPFLQAMGYDVFDHKEVAKEYTADFGSKKGEKVDVAILRDGSPVILIECKPLGDNLDTGKCSQLFRYFSTQPARIGILTNGQRYLFFSDLEQQNVMDAKPFMDIDLLNFNERTLPELQRLTKDEWDIEGALSSAEILKYVRAVKLLIAQNAADPSEAFVRFFASQSISGRKIITAKVVDNFRNVVKRAFSEYISDEIGKRLESVRKVEEHIQISPKIDLSEEKIEIMTEEEVGDGIITYNTERWAYVIIKTLLREVVDVSRIAMRDQKSYCGILLDDNNRKPICRLYNFCHYEEGMDNIGHNAHIVIMTEGKGKGESERYDLQTLEDIYPLSDKLIAAVKKYLPEE